KDGSDHAFKLLERDMGTVGVDILYDIAWGQSGAAYPAAAQRAQRSLTKNDVRGRASPALLVTLDVRGAAGCDAKENLLSPARVGGRGRELHAGAAEAEVQHLGVALPADFHVLEAHGHAHGAPLVHAKRPRRHGGRMYQGAERLIGEKPGRPVTMGAGMR